MDPKVLFEPPPPFASYVKLAITPKPGDANPFLAKLWEEIQKIDQLIELMESGYDADRTSLGATLVDSSSPILNDIRCLLNEPSVPNWKKGLELSDSFDVVLKRVSELDRSDVDFTDKLWNILKTTNQPTELLDCFNVAFSAVEKKLYRPYLFPSNSTQVSSILKTIGNQNGNYRLKMNFSYVLALAINCGINKLYKDYFFILSTCKLAEQNDLKAFAPQEKPVKESLMDVKKLHCMLEVLCLSKDRLALSLLDQEAQMRVLLKHFQENKVDWEHTFHFDVPFNAVANFINGTHPIYWNLKLESSNSHRITRTNAVLSKDFFIGHARKFYVNGDGLIPRGYYLYVHRIAQRKI
jgi:hypothetical protein